MLKLYSLLGVRVFLVSGSLLLLVNTSTSPSFPFYSCSAPALPLSPHLIMSPSRIVSSCLYVVDLIQYRDFPVGYSCWSCIDCLLVGHRWSVVVFLVNVTAIVKGST